MFQKTEMGLGPGGDLTCRGGGRKEAGRLEWGKPKRGLGQQQKKLARSALALGPFSFRSPPMEVQPPVSPQQSECNPVGALQVCPLLISCACLSSLEPGAMREGYGEHLPFLRAFISPHSFLLWSGI